MMVDSAFAEQMAMEDWHADEERGPQPEDEPLDEACSTERFFLGTPQGSQPALPMHPERACHPDPGDTRRDSPRTPLRRSSRRLSARARKRAAMRSMNDNSWIQAPIYGELASWTPQKQGLAREIQDLRSCTRTNAES